VKQGLLVHPVLHLAVVVGHLVVAVHPFLVVGEHLSFLAEEALLPLLLAEPLHYALNLIEHLLHRFAVANLEFVD